MFLLFVELPLLLGLASHAQSVDVGDAVVWCEAFGRYALNEFQGVLFLQLAYLLAAVADKVAAAARIRYALVQGRCACGWMAEQQVGTCKEIGGCVECGHADMEALLLHHLHKPIDSERLVGLVDGFQYGQALLGAAQLVGL